jgi:hypothetical protein
MMDATKLIPSGYHFVLPDTIDGYRPIEVLPRSTLPDPKYYFIDFDVSAVLLLKAQNQMRREKPLGQDRTVPEFQPGYESSTYDPYKVDVYQLGSTISRRIVEVTVAIFAFNHY